MPGKWRGWRTGRIRARSRRPNRTSDAVRRRRAGLATPSGMSSVGGLGLERDPRTHRTPKTEDRGRHGRRRDPESLHHFARASQLVNRREHDGFSPHLRHPASAAPPPEVGQPSLPPSGPAGMDLGRVELALNPERSTLWTLMQAKAEFALRENHVKFNFNLNIIYFFVFSHWKIVLAFRLFFFTRP